MAQSTCNPKRIRKQRITYPNKRVSRLISIAKLYGVGSYKRKPKHKAGAKHKAHPNHLQQYFIANTPNESWQVISLILEHTKAGFTLPQL